MGILSDIINKKAQEIVDKKIEKENRESISGTTEITPYNRLWLNKIANEAGYAISDNDKRVDTILKKLNERDGHCPCGGMTDEFICPCRMMREYGACKCGLYMNAKDINPTDTKTAGKIKE